MVLFSSLFCVPCQATRRVLAEVERLVPGLAVEEIDVAADPERAEGEGIRSTPTILLVAGDREVLRAEGVPTVPQVLAAVVRAMDAPAADGSASPASPASPGSSHPA